VFTSLLTFVRASFASPHLALHWHYTIVIGTSGGKL
jgi:hypothetical protein